MNFYQQDNARKYAEFCKALDDAKRDHIAECEDYSICPECGDKVVDGECVAWAQEQSAQYNINEGIVS